MQLQQSEERAEQKEADFQAAQDELSRCQKQLSDAHAEHQQLAQSMAALVEQQEASKREVGWLAVAGLPGKTLLGPAASCCSFCQREKVAAAAPKEGSKF